MVVSVIHITININYHHNIHSFTKIKHMIIFVNYRNNYIIDNICFKNSISSKKRPTLKLFFCGHLLVIDHVLSKMKNIFGVIPRSIFQW